MGQWDSLSGPSTASIDGLAFLPNGSTLALSNNTLFSSTNIGDSWQQIYIAPTAYRLNGLTTDQNGNIFIGAETDTIYSAHNRQYWVSVIKSSDMGTSWGNVYNAGTGGLHSPCIASNKTGDVIIGFGSSGFGFSTDQGTTWQEKYGYWVLGVAISPSRGFYVTTPFQGLIRSTDLGITWSTCPGTSESVIYRKIICSFSDTLFVEGSNIIYRSIDGGNTWNQVLSGYLPTVFGKDISGTVYFGTTNDLYCTTDGGTTWHTKGLVNVSITSLAFRSDGFALVGSASGLVYRTKTSSTTNIRYSPPTSFQLQQNYPNPFNPNTKISFSLAHRTFTKLQIINAIGQVITTLVCEPLNAGSHVTEWNARNIASGIYFCRLQTSDYVEMKKMLLLK
jgi:photosystem II stability/assembly factor-like uncharacterized protein